MTVSALRDGQTPEQARMRVTLWLCIAGSLAALVIIAIIVWKQSSDAEAEPGGGVFAARPPTVEPVIGPEQLADADRRLAAAMREAERLDGPWRLDDIDKRAKTPDKENLAHQLREIAEKMPPKWPAYLYRPYDAARPGNPDGYALDKGTFGRIALTTLLTSPQLAELRAELKRGAAALAVARRLADQPSGRIPFSWPDAKDLPNKLDELPEVFSPPLSLIFFDGLIRAQEGDMEGALQSCRAILGVMAAIGDTPTYGAQCYRANQTASVAFSLERVLALGEPPAPALAALQAQLTAELGLPLMVIAARGARAALDRFCEAMQKGEVPVADIVLPHLYGTDWRPEEEKRALTYVRALVLEKMNQKVEIHKLPLEQQAPRFKELQSSISKGPRLVRLLASVKAQETEGWQREQARLHCAIAALAVERFRQEHGRWPGTLADLVPEFLPALPIDPYTRTHLGYHRQKEGVVVFSHGLDTTLYSDRATTDAANNIFETLNNVMQTDKLGFRLWATHLRRQRQE